MIHCAHNTSIPVYVVTDVLDNHKITCSQPVLVSLTVQLGKDLGRPPVCYISGNRAIMLYLMKPAVMQYLPVLAPEISSVRDHIVSG